MTGWLDPALDVNNHNGALEVEDRPPYRVDLVIDGALEWSDDHPTIEAAKRHFNNAISETAAEAPGKDWELTLYDNRPEPPEILDMHEHDAEPEYEVTFSVIVHAEGTEEAQQAAIDVLRQRMENDDLVPDETRLFH